jgi:O-antigen/teichoic acid export membrane protein
MNLTRSGLKLAVANGAGAAVTFGGIALFANRLPPSQLGIFFLFEALIGVLTIPADLGIRGAVEKRISEGTNPERMLSSAVLLKTLPLLLIAGCVAVFGEYINDYVGAEIALLLIVAIVAHELYHLSVQVVSGELRVGETASLRLTQKVVWVVVGYALLESGFGVGGLMYGLIVGYVIAFLWAMYKRSTPFGRPSMAHARSLTIYSRYNFVSAVSGYVYSWMDILIIGLFLTTADVGAYEVAWRVTAVVILGSTAIAHTIFPQVSRWDADEAVDRIERLVPRAITPSLLVAVPSFFGTILFSREILTFVFDAEYAAAWLVLTLLMGEKIFQSIHVVTGRSLKAIDHPELAARAAVAAITTNLVLNLVLVWQYGLVGAAVATVVSFGLNTVLCIRYLSRFLTVRLPWTDLRWISVASVVMAVVLAGIESVFAVDTLLRLVCVILVGAVVYGCVLLVSPSLRERAVRSLSTLQPNESVDEPA